jgi:tetratricopeptide (TPR) repeat protein
MPMAGKPATTSVGTFTAPPDPAQAGNLDDLVEQMRLLKVWAGDPSYERIKNRINAAWTAAGRPADELVCKSTVAYCFRPGRRRLDTELVMAVVQTLHPDTGYVMQWRQALRLIGGEIEAVSQVRVQDSLPQDLAGFTGRTGELDRLRDAARDGEAVVISAIEGMPGVGKTQLAVHAGHLLHREKPFEQVLFVNLRGFDPDTTQPPVDPAAVLDGFLRLLGMPGHQIPHDLTARAAVYRDHLAGTRTLVVLDNAATADQVRALLPAAAGCLVMVTSRRRLADLHPATHLSVDVFTPDEALQFLTSAVPGVRTGPDPHAADRIVQRCGYLPLALSVVAGHIRGTAGWTLTDHADRLDERHDQRRLDTGVELALHQSYQHLSAARQRLLRLLALHPGPDIDVYAAAALTGTGVDTVSEDLRHLCADHLLQQTAPDRVVFHDLVRAYAAAQAADEDRPSARREALTDLFDYFVHTASAAAESLFPAERNRLPRIPSGTPIPPVSDPAVALTWLDAERANLIAVAGHAADHGWPAHTTGLAAALWRHLDASGHYKAAAFVHTRAQQAARDTGDRAAEAQFLNNLGVADWRLGRYRQAASRHERALALCREVGDSEGEARALGNLGIVCWGLGRYEQAADHLQRTLALHRELGNRDSAGLTLNNIGLLLQRLGRYQQAIDHHQQALELHRDIGDRCGEGYALDALGLVHVRLGRYDQATGELLQALTLFRQTGAREGEAYALDALGLVDLRLGRVGQALDHHRQALALFRETGAREGEADALNNLGNVYRRLGDHRRAIEHHRRSVALFREMGDPGGVVTALNSLGETLHAADQPRRARISYAAALTRATEIEERYEQACAHRGLACIHHAAGDADQAYQHWQDALALFVDLGVPEGDRRHWPLPHDLPSAATRSR